MNHDGFLDIDSSEGGLIRRLREMDPTLGAYLERLIEDRWPQMWLGDQITEVAERGRHHSKKLMEIAESLLFVLDRGEKGCASLFIDEPLPLALLISSIYLHDIGYTALVYPIDPDEAKDTGAFPFSMFPSAVSEVHHLLSSELISHNGERLFPLPEDVGLELDSDAGEKLMEAVEILKGVLPDICASHRKYVQLDRTVDFEKKKAVWQVGKLLMGKERFKDTLTPLDDRLDSCARLFEKDGPLGLTKKKALTVAAFLRVLDGCDLQSEGAFDEGRLRQWFQRTSYEIESLEIQLDMFDRDLKELMVNLEGKPISVYDCVKAICDDVEDFSFERVSTKRVGRICKALYPFVFKTLRRLKGKKGFDCLFKPDSLPSVQALSLVDRLVFKWEGFLAFHMSGFVEGVSFVSGEGDSCDIGVRVDFKKDVPVEGELTSFAEGLSEEIDRTGRYLRDLGLSVISDS